MIWRLTVKCEALVKCWALLGIECQLWWNLFYIVSFKTPSSVPALCDLLQPLWLYVLCDRKILGIMENTWTTGNNFVDFTLFLWSEVFLEYLRSYTVVVLMECCLEGPQRWLCRSGFFSAASWKWSRGFKILALSVHRAAPALGRPELCWPHLYLLLKAC